MKKSEKVKIRSMTVDQIKKIVGEKRDNLLKYASGVLDKNNKNRKKVWSTRKELALLLTILKEKEMEGK